MELKLTSTIAIVLFVCTACNSSSTAQKNNNTHDSHTNHLEQRRRLEREASLLRRGAAAAACACAAGGTCTRRRISEIVGVHQIAKVRLEVHLVPLPPRPYEQVSEVDPAPEGGCSVGAAQLPSGGVEVQVGLERGVRTQPHYCG